MPRDYTASERDRLQREYSEEQALARSKMSLVSQVVREGHKGEVDLMPLFAQAVPAPVTTEGEDGIVVDDVEDPLWRQERFRCSDDIEGFTYGKDVHLDLAMGQTYLAPYCVVEHLDNLGLVDRWA